MIHRLMFLLLCLAASRVFGQEKICGSVEQYMRGRTFEWKNLPGCTGETESSDPGIAGVSRAKEACGKYMEEYQKARTGPDALNVESLPVSGGAVREVCTGGFSGGGAGAAWTKDPRFREPVAVESNGRKNSVSVVQIYASWDRIIEAYGKAADSAWRLQTAYDQFKAATDRDARLAAAKRYTDVLSAAREGKVGGELINRRLQPRAERDLWKEIETWLNEDMQREKAEYAKVQKEWDELSPEAGDKLFYIQTVKKGYAVYTYRGIIVKTPQDFKNATGLFRCVIDDASGTWYVDGAFFKGNKEVAPYQDSGAGVRCPTRAYPTAEPK